MEKIINDLVGYKNMKIVQCKEYFNFSLDSVLLPNFVTLKEKISNIMDLGCGNAPISLILSTKTNANITGVEIQKEIYDLAVESVKLNHKDDQIKIINNDIKDLPKIYNSECIDVIVTNPPYFKKIDTSILNENNVKSNARHETLISLDDIIKVSSYLLKNKGSFAIVHRTERLNEILSVMNKYKIEAKKIRFVYPRLNENSNIVLVEGIKNGNSGLKVLPPLVAHNDDGSYTEEILKMFE